MEANFLDDILIAFQQEAPRPAENANFERMAQHIADVIMQRKSIQHYLLTLKEHTDTHYAHSLRVGVMFYELANEAEIARHFADETMALAGTAHDCGKDKIPRAILEKPARLNAEEVKVMKAHNRIGYLHLKNLASEFPYLPTIVVGHHKYPRANPKRRNEERRELALLDEPADRKAPRRQLERRVQQPYIGRARMLLEMTDIYDALSSKRSYKRPFAPEEIFTELSTFFPLDEKLIHYLMKNYPGPQNNDANKP